MEYPTVERRWAKTSMRRFSRPLTFNLGLISVYWLSLAAQSDSLPVGVIRALIGAFLAFYMVGHSFRTASVESTRFDSVSLGGRLVFDVALSLVFLTTASLVLTILYLLNEVNLALFLTLVTIGSTIGGIARRRFPVVIRPMTIFPAASVASVIGIVAVGLLVAFIFRRGFVWPSMPGWDIYVHLGVSNWIYEHNGSTNIIVTGSNAFSAYPYLFHVLVASVSYILGYRPYDVLWAGSFYSIPLYGLLIYGLAAFLTRIKIQAIFASCLAMSISGGESLLGPQYFFPSTAFIIVFVLSILAIGESPLQGLPQTLLSASALTICYLLYYFTLFLSLVPLIIVLMKRNPNLFHESWRRLILVAIFGASILLTYAGSLLLSSGDLSINVKLALLMTAYPIVLWSLIAAGGIFIVYRLFSKRVPRYFDHLILAYVGTMLTFYLLPLHFSHRSELMLRPFAAIVASYSVGALTWIVTSPKVSRVNVMRILSATRFPARVSMLLFLAISTILVAQPYLTYGQRVPGWSNLSSDEYQAAQWLEKTAPENSYILTDPSTGFVFRGLTLLNSSNSFIIGGHTPSPQGYPQLALIIYSFFTSRNITEAQTYLSLLPQRPGFIVVTTRTASWASWGGLNSIFPAPTSNKPDSFPGYEKLTTPLFSLEASWDTVKIYRLMG